MMDFEKRQDTIRNNLILITEKLTDKEDKDEHKEKIIDFSASFTELYVNTYDLMHQFGQLNNII
ncbi:TPA: hypothetical protein DCZ39_05805 [Patescibacteria group bacterium]|nr:hypothetical protein [Candidatus Gracilibacteria bacterium]